MRFVGVDTGGTFTDVLMFDSASGMLRARKYPSTPHDPSEAFLQGVDEIAAEGVLRLASIDRMAHATTVATNAVIERAGATTGLITTKGFRDVLAIGRGGRPPFAVYDLHWHRPEPLVPRYLRLGVSERVDVSGRILVPVQREEVLSAAAFLVRHGVQAFAVCFLFAYINPANELLVKSWLAEAYPDLPVSVSTDILPQWREYERTSTTVADAYIRPVMSRYIGRLVTRLRERSVPNEMLVIRSNGGVARASTVCETPIETFLSGPAAAVVAAGHIGRQAGFADLVSIDMGGTSFDIAILENGEARHTTEGEILPSVPVRVPMVDVRAIGAGGGSVAWIDAGGALKVGPRSARAVPGPACYGRGGTEATITDANVVLGRIHPAHFLGGLFPLRADLARDAVARIGEQLGLDVHPAAQGILDIAVSNMTQAIRAAAAERGIDLRRFTLFAGGGAGPLAATAIARDLQMRTVLVPRFPGMLSTIGLLLSDLRFDAVQSMPVVLEQADLHLIGARLRAMAEDVTAKIRRENLNAELDIRTFLDMRYRRQNWEIGIPADPETLSVGGVAAAFGAEHEKLFGFRNAGAQHEIINLRCTGVGRLREKDDLLARFSPIFPDKVAAPLDTLALYDEALRDTVQAAVFERDAMPAHQVIAGPALVVEPDSTLYIPGDGHARLDAFGNMIIRFGAPD
jgi:N-methylhydantoinase A